VLFHFRRGAGACEPYHYRALRVPHAAQAGVAPLAALKVTFARRAAVEFMILRKNCLQEL
jgi:hypothetical protein